MKKIWLTCMLAVLAGIVAIAQPMNDGYSLTSLWKKYEAARKADRPQLEAEILSQIKQEALQQHLALDFYDAATLYVTTVQRRDWKQRDALNKALEEEVASFNEPIVTFQWMSRWKYASTDALWEYVKAHPDGFKGRTSGFYQDASEYLGGTLPLFIANDREFVLWRMLSSNSVSEKDDIYKALLEEVEGRYPSQAALEYYAVSSHYYPADQREECRQALGLLAKKYEGKAVSVFPKAALLQMRKEDLDKKKDAGSAYASLCNTARALEKERKAYTGSEATIADACHGAERLIETLTASDVDVTVKDGHIQVLLRNLSQVNVTLREDKKSLKTWKLKNPKESFYVRDTLVVALPKLEDGDYTVEAVNGKLTDQAHYTQYTLSIASRTDSRGPAVYVTDYNSGEPLSKATLLLMKGSRQIAKTSLKLSGFTVLPEAFIKDLLKDKDSYYEVVAVSGDRKSRSVSIRKTRVERSNNSSTQCYIYKDQGAYHPGDTVRYKAVVFKGDPAQDLAVCKGRSIEVRLLDSEGNRLASQKLTTNAWGAASGQFVLPKGLRNGHFALEVDELCYESFPVDEFVLPTYELVFDQLEEFFMAGDSIPVSGRLQSYSGHSLAGARVAVKVERYGDVLLEDTQEAGADSDFHFSFPTKETGYYHATVTVTDFTGETRSFGKGYYVGDEVEIDASVADAAPVELETVRDDDDWRHAPSYTLLQSTLRMTLKAMDEDGNVVPLPVGFQVFSADGSTLASGQVQSGNSFSVELPGSGYYKVHARVEGESKSGKKVDCEEDFAVFCILPESKELMPQARRVFIPGPKTVAEGGSVRARIGTTEGTVYAQVMVYGMGEQLLESKEVVVADGSLENLAFAYKKNWPDVVRLQVFYFLHGASVSYDREYRREKNRYTMPLEFTRFQDKAYPGTRYTFALKTTPDAEVLVAAWDKSLDAVAENEWPEVSTYDYGLPQIWITPVCGVVGEAYRPRPIMMRAGGKYMMNATPMMADAVEYEYAAMDGAVESKAVSDDAGVMAYGLGGGEDTPVRSDFASALTFQPHLRPGADGTLHFSFKTSDKLSTFYVRAYAHDAAMHNATVEEEMVVSIPVKVSLLEPRFLYEGDVYDAAVTVSSIADKPVSGTIVLVLSEPGKPVSSQMVPVTVQPGASVNHRFRITAPVIPDSDWESLTIKAIFRATDFSDAVQVTVPVYPAAQTLTEAYSAVLLDGMNREALLQNLRSRFVNMPASAATLREITVLDMVRDAIPSHVEPQGKDVLSLSEAWYISLLASRLGVVISSEAEGGVEKSLLQKILACRNADGGFGWFEGMHSSPVITAVLLERIAKLRDRGFEVPEVTSAVKYLDANQFGSERPYWCGGISDAQYLHVRALYANVPFEVKPVSETDKKRFKTFTKWAKDYLTPGKKDGRGLQGQILNKSRRLLTLRNLLEREGGIALAKDWGVSLATKAKLEKSMQADLLSLVEYAVAHPSGGYYYPNAVMPWRGLLESEAYAHALLCDLLAAFGDSSASVGMTNSVISSPSSPVISSGAAGGVEKSPSAIADGIRLWLMLQKETQHWDSEPAFIDAITSILDGSQAVMNTRVLALSGSYRAPFKAIKAAGNGFKLERQFFKEGSDVELKPGDPVAVGDKIVVKYKIWNGENRSFVKLTAGREASLQPEKQLSGHVGYGFIRPLRNGFVWGFVPQGYRNVKASATEYYFDSYPEENTEITETFYVQQAGRFQAPVVEIESLYAPHYRANSASRPALTVTDN